MRAIILWSVFHFFFVVSLFSCVSCGESQPTVEMEDLFKPHFDMFIAVCKKHGSPRNADKCEHAGHFLARIDFIEQPDEDYPKAIGLCIPDAENGSRIEILRSDFMKMRDASRARLIGHELGLCVLGLDHTPAPFGLMTAVFPTNDMPIEVLIIEAVKE